MGVEDEDADLVAELIALYLEDAQHHIDDIRSAATEGDMMRLTLAAHTLKGSSAQVGAAELSELCDQLENIELGTTPHLARGLIGKLESRFSDACSVLVAQLRGLPR